MLVFEAEFMVCLRHGSASCQDSYIRFLELPDSARLGSTKHALWFHVSINDDTKLTPWYITLVTNGPSLPEAALEGILLLENRLLQVALLDHLPFLDTVALTILQMTE